MLVPFGWSVGDIFAAIEFISKVVEALQAGSSAHKQYSLACSFLDALRCTLERIARYVGSKDPITNSNVEVQMLLDVVQSEFESFRTYLLNRYSCLSGSQGWIKQKLGTVWWTKDQMNSRVLELKQSITDALVALNTTLLLDSLEDIRVGKELQENFVRQNLDLLTDVHKRICGIESSIYKDTRAKKMTLQGLDQDIEKLKNAASQNRQTMCICEEDEKAHGAINTTLKNQTEANIAMINAIDRMLDAKLDWFYDYLEKGSGKSLDEVEMQEIRDMKRQIRRSQHDLTAVADDASSYLTTIGSTLHTIQDLDGQKWSRWMAPAAKHLSGFGSLIQDGKKLAQITPKLLSHCDQFLR